MKTIVAIGRSERYSPNSVAKDRAIMDSVCCLLVRAGLQTVRLPEDDLQAEALPEADLYLSMGRHPHTLQLLKECEARGARVVNGTAGVALCCRRAKLFDLLERGGVPVPPAEGEHGFWLKRADGVAEGPGDVVFAASRDEMAARRSEMAAHGVTDIYQCAHMEGDLLKFYGVRGTGFFYVCYPGDDGMWKFDDERRNGRPRHYAFDAGALRAMAGRAAALAGVQVYGGDCIVGADGSVTLIDLNDWPSFSRCREEAARAIAGAVDMR